jgi:hypothetical protein
VSAVPPYRIIFNSCQVLLQHEHFFDASSIKFKPLLFFYLYYRRNKGRKRKKNKNKIKKEDRLRTGSAHWPCGRRKGDV